MVLVRSKELVDLLSDSEDGVESSQSGVGSASSSNRQRGGAHAFRGARDTSSSRRSNTVDLTASEDGLEPGMPHDGPLDPAVCLQMILDVLPDIAISHALELINQAAESSVLTTDACERLISRILDGAAYPKEQDGINKRKRKRPADEEDEYGNESSEPENCGHSLYRQDALNLLKDEFLAMPVRHIENVLDEQKSLRSSFATLEGQLRNYNSISSNPFRKVSKPRSYRGFEATFAAVGKKIVSELNAARNRIKKEEEKRQRQKYLVRLEENNLAKSLATGDMGECQCCFDDKPINRMTCCNGDIIHFFCRECTRTYVETEIGNMKCQLVCFADENCGGTFSRQHLLDSVSKTTFERLEHLQQQAAINAANLDFLDECPFCDYKAECPPVEQDKEFRCQGPTCGKVSCRLCLKETHIPMSCEEVKKEEKLNVRHTIEEAKSEALIRKCNRCKNPFIKELGCNKMTCSKCGNVQCYVCSKNVSSYDHFRAQGCPLHDNQEDRHEEDVQKAEAEAVRKIRAERPDISEEELKIQFSDRVRQEEATRRQRAHAQHQNFGFYMEGDQLRARPVGNAPIPQNGRGDRPPAVLPRAGPAHPPPQLQLPHQPLPQQPLPQQPPVMGPVFPAAFPPPFPANYHGLPRELLAGVPEHPQFNIMQEGRQEQQMFQQQQQYAYQRHQHQQHAYQMHQQQQHAYQMHQQQQQRHAYQMNRQQQQQRAHQMHQQHLDQRYQQQHD